jgi:uncharacterized phage protein gp47/JayE
MSNYQPRTISQIQQNLFQYLIEQNSKLNDISPGSVLYTITRAIAGIHSEQELLLNELSRSYFPSTATGELLDLLASNYGIRRIRGDFAKGKAAISALISGVELLNELMIDPVSGLQFFIDSDKERNLNNLTEYYVPIQAARLGKEYNLPAGTKLVIPNYPSVKAYVGSHRNDTGALCGDLKRGRSNETDDSLRERIIDFILNKRATTNTALTNLLIQDPAVTWVSISSPLPGYIEVWVDSVTPLTSSQKDRLTELIKNNIAAGISFSIKQPQKQLVEINYLVNPIQGFNITELTERIITITNNYFNNLTINTTLDINELQQIVKRVEGVSFIRLLTPTESVTPITSESLIRSSNILITYDVV